MSILNVTVKRAKYIGVQSTQLNTYVALKLQNVKTTTICVKGSEPCWDQDFLFETEPHVNDIGLLIEIWSKGMIWDRVLGYKFITLNSILTQQNKIKQQRANSNLYSKVPNEKWYQLDLECITVNGDVTDTKNPTGDMILLDCRFDEPFPGYTETTEYSSNLTCAGTEYTSGSINHINASPIGQELNKQQLLQQQQQNYFQDRSLETSRENSYDVDDRSSYYDYYSDSAKKMTTSYSPNDGFYYDNKDEMDPLSYNSRPKSAINILNQNIKTSQCKNHNLERQDKIINCNDDLYYNENDYDYEENLNNSINNKYVDQDYYICNDKLLHQLEYYDAQSNPESDIMIYDMRYNQDYYDDTNQMHKNQPTSQLNKQLPKIPVKNGSSYFDDGMNDNYSQNLGLAELPVQEQKPYHQHKKIRMLPQPNRSNQNSQTNSYSNSSSNKFLPQPILDSSQPTEPSQDYYNQMYPQQHRKVGKTLPSIPMSQASTKKASKITHLEIDDDREDYFYDASSNLTETTGTQNQSGKKSTTKKLLPQPIIQIGPKPYDIKTEGFKSSDSTKISKSIESPKSTTKQLPKAPFQSDAKILGTKNLNDRRRSSTTITSPIQNLDSIDKLSSELYYSAKNDLSPVKLNQSHLLDDQSPVKLDHERRDSVQDKSDVELERITKLSDDILNDNKFHSASTMFSESEILDSMKFLSASQTAEANKENLPYFSALTPDFSYLFDTNASIDRHKYRNNFNNLKSTSIYDLIAERDSLGSVTSYMDDHKLDDAEYLRRYGYMKFSKPNHKLQIIGDLNLNSSTKLLTDEELKLELDKIRNLYDNDIEEYKRKLRLKYLNELNLNYQQKQQELQGELLLQHHNSKLNKINNYYDDNDIDNKSSILKYYQNNMILSKQAEKLKNVNDLNQETDGSLDVKLDNILSKNYLDLNSKLDGSKHKNYDTTVILNRFKESEKFLDNYKQNKIKLLEEQKNLELAKDKLIVDTEKSDNLDSETETININNDNLSDQRLNDKNNINLLNNINNNLNLNNNLISNKNLCEFYNSSNNKNNVDNNKLIEQTGEKLKKSGEFTTKPETKSNKIETDDKLVTNDFVSFLNKYNYTTPAVTTATSTASFLDALSISTETTSSEAIGLNETKTVDSINSALPAVESLAEISEATTKTTTTSDYLSWQTDFMSDDLNRSRKLDLEPQITSTAKTTTTISSVLDQPKKLLDITSTIGVSTVISTGVSTSKITIASPKSSSTSFFSTLTQQQQQPQPEPINIGEQKPQSVLGAFTSGLKGTLGNVVAGQQQQQSATQQAASTLTSAAKGFGFGLANKFATLTGQQQPQSQQQQKTQQQQPQNLTKKLFNNFTPATTNMTTANTSEQQSFYNIQNQPIRNIKNEIVVPAASTTSSQLDILDKFSGTFTGPNLLQATTTTISTSVTPIITTTIRTEPLDRTNSATTTLTTTASNNNIVEQQWQKYDDSSSLITDSYHIKSDIVGQQDYTTLVTMNNETVLPEQNTIQSGMIDDLHYSRYGDSVLDSNMLLSNLLHTEAKTSTLYIATDPISIQKTDESLIFEPDSSNEIADGNIDLSQNSSNYICDNNLSGIDQSKPSTMVTTLALTTNENKLASSAQFPSNITTVAPKAAVIPPKEKEQPPQQQQSSGGLFGSFLSKAKGAAAAITIVPSANSHQESGTGTTQSATSGLGALRNMGGKLGGDFVKALSSQIQPQQTPASKTGNLTGLSNNGNYNLMIMDNQQQQNKFLPQLPMLDRQQQQNSTTAKKTLPQIQTVDTQQLIRQGTNNLLQKQQPTEIYVDTDFYNNLNDSQLTQNNLIDASDNEVLHYDNDYYLNSLNINHEYSAHSKPLKSNYDQNKFCNGIENATKNYKSNFINNQNISEPLHLNHISFNYQSSSSQQQQKNNHLATTQQEPEIYEEHFENPNEYYLNENDYSNLENYSNYYDPSQQDGFQHHKYYHHNYNEDFFNEEDELDYLSNNNHDQLPKNRLPQQIYNYEDENDESDEIDDDDDDDDNKLDPYKQHYYYHQPISNNNNILQLQQQQKFVTKEKLLLQQHQKQPPLDYIEESNDDYFDNGMNLSGATVTDVTPTTAINANTTTTLKDISVINYGTTIADTKTKTSTIAATVVPLSTTVKSQSATTAPIIENDFKELPLKSSITANTGNTTVTTTATNLLTKQAAQQGLHKQKSIVDDDDDDDADDDDDDEDDLDLFNNDLDESYIDEEDDSQNAIELYEKDDKLMALHKINNNNNNNNNNNGSKIINSKLPEDVPTIQATIPIPTTGLNFSAKITTPAAAKKSISFGGAAAGVAAAIAVDPTAIATDLVIGSEEQQQLIAAGKKNSILQRGETEEIITGDIGIRSGSPPIKSDVTPRQRWHWAYNKIIMQLNVSNFNIYFCFFNYIH